MRDNPPCPACGARVNRLDVCANTEVLHCAVCGVFCEQDRTTRVTYDASYVDVRYNRYKTTGAMSCLRLRVLQAVLYAHESAPTDDPYTGFIRRGPLLDVGYGNGDFIVHARGEGWDAFGNDVNPTEYPGVRRVDLPLDPLPKHYKGWGRYRVITFFDSLEHFEDLRAVAKVSAATDWIMVSVPLAPVGFPWCQWKHRRPGEHHFYFQGARSLEMVFSTAATRVTAAYVGHPEDVIRGTLPDGQPNILTCILRCEHP